MLLLILILWASFAISFPLGKLILDLGIPPLDLISIRMTLAGACMLGWLRFNDKNYVKKMPQLKGLFASLVKISLFHIYLNFLLEFWALQYTDPIKASLIFSISPLVTGILSFFILKERLKPLQILSIFIGFCSTALLLPIKGTTPINTSLQLPDMALLASVTMSAYAWFEIKKLLDKGFSLLFINGVAMMIGGGMATAHRLLTVGICHYYKTPQATSAYALIFIVIIFSNFIGYNLYGFLLKKYSPTYLSLSGVLCPIFVTLFSALIYGTEILSAWHAASFALSCFSLWLFHSEKKLSASIS
jgi:drug/metabolite transporter (DMT)-like permease